MATPERPTSGWRIAALALRVFAFGSIGALGYVVWRTPELRLQLGPDSWLASLLPGEPSTLGLWVCIALLNAGAALFLAAYLDS